MFTQLMAMMRKPELYEKGTAELWTDEHISKGMLESHLNPDWDSATRKHSFVRKSVNWIGMVAPVERYYDLLDLGCGAGVYAEELHKTGYRVTGLDFSERSVNYARNSALEKSLPITYHHRDYLTLDFKAQFDLITLVNYDFGVLSTENRAKLLQNIHVALKPGGLLIFDVFTPFQYAERKESKSWEYADKGFICGEPHICLESKFQYEEQNTFCSQYIVITEQEVKSINVWEHTFTKDEITQNLSHAGFSIKGIYSDIAGAEYCDKGKEMCIVAQKEENNHEGI